jgi:uncharacterized protein (TIGR02147 family)
MQNLFSALDYRKYLRHWLEASERPRGVLSRMAEALGCQNSHLSRLIREEVHLTPDQAFEACRFMNLSEPETQYFLKLVEYERAANPRYRARLMSELKALKREQEDLSSRFRAEKVAGSESEMVYYSAWFWSAIHILTDIPGFRTPRAIAKRLGLDEALVRHALEQLARFHLVERKTGDNWHISSNSIHLPKQSPMISVHHGNWRARAITDAQNPANTSLHYTTVLTAGHEDIARLKQILLEAIDRFRVVAEASPSEDLMCFSCDFFQV